MKRMEEIYRIYEQKMYYLAYAILRDESRAEDAVSEAFLKLIPCLSGIDSADSPSCRSLVMKVTKNAAIDIYRKVHRDRIWNQELQEDGGPCEDDVIMGTINALDAKKLVQKCLKDMPEPLKELVRLKYFGQLDNKEIAVILQVSVEAVRKRDQRLREYIMKKAGDQYE